jgi:hypothetical protein
MQLAVGPLMVMVCPLPSIVSPPPLLMIVGKVLAGVIVPLTSKVMVSSAGVDKASVMACRSDPGPLLPVLVTTIGAAYATGAGPIASQLTRSITHNTVFQTSRDLIGEIFFFMVYSLI